MSITLKDQLGRIVRVPQKPLRIVSLMPSQTELLVDLGLEEHIVGVTKFCIHPAHLRKAKTVVGGTKNVSFEKIKALEPDIILCNKEENTKEIVTVLEKTYPVHVSDIATIQEALDMIMDYGTLFQCKDKALELCTIIKRKLMDFKAFIALRPKRRVAYFIWRKPWMVVGNQTFIHHLLELNGFINVFEMQNRYPEVDMDTLGKTAPELLLLSSEPFPFQEKHFKEARELAPNATPVLVDGEYFSWYGSRLQYTFDYFKSLHHSL